MHNGSNAAAKTWTEDHLQPSQTCTTIELSRIGLDLRAMNLGDQKTQDRDTGKRHKRFNHKNQESCMVNICFKNHALPATSGHAVLASSHRRCPAQQFGLRGPFGLCVMALSASCSPASSKQDPQDSPGKGRYVFMEGLSKRWDDVEDVRVRLRSGNNLIMNDDGDGLAQNVYVAKSLANVKLNAVPLREVLKIMALNHLQVPPVNPLTEQIQKLLVKYKPDAALGDVAYQQAWAIRRLCGALKGTIYKPKPPKDNLFLGVSTSSSRKVGTTKPRLVSRYIKLTSLSRSSVLLVRTKLCAP